MDESLGKFDMSSVRQGRRKWRVPNMTKILAGADDRKRREIPRIRRPTHSSQRSSRDANTVQERTRKRMSACFAGNDTVVGGRAFVGAKAPASCCTGVMPWLEPRGPRPGRLVVGGVGRCRYV